MSGLSIILGRLLPEPHAGLMIGLLFGTKASLSQDFYNALVTTGTLHIIALSGMNITIIMDIMAKMIQWRVGKRWACAISMLIIVWFVWFVGPSSTIVRAAIMGCLSLIAIIFGRQYIALYSWVIAVTGMVLFHFSWMFEVSFQLSALATLGIILFGKSDQKQLVKEVHAEKQPLWSTVYQGIKEDLHLTLAAQVFTIPLIMFHFHRVSIISPLANLAIAWTVPPLTFLGWITVMVGWVSLPLGHLFALISWVLLEYMIRVIQIVSSIPMASFGW